MKRKRTMRGTKRVSRARSRVTSHKKSLRDETRYAANIDACSSTHDYLFFLYIPLYFYGAAVPQCLRRIARLVQPRRKCSFFFTTQSIPIYRSDGSLCASIPAISLQATDRCSAPITRVLALALCGGKKERDRGEGEGGGEREKFRMPALSILIGSSEPWQDLYSPDQ